MSLNDMPLQKLIRKGKFTNLYLIREKNEKCALKVFKNQAIAQKEAFLWNLLYPEFPANLIEGHQLKRPWINAKPLMKVDRKKFYNENLLKEMLLTLFGQIENLHLAGYLHFDIKPEHILVDSSNKVYLIDFSNALPVSEISTEEKYPYPTCYAPQECIFHINKAIGPWSDIFMACMSILHWLTGESPVPNDNPVFSLHAQLNFQYRSNTMFSKKLNQIFEKALKQHIFFRPPHHYEKTEIEKFIIEAVNQRFATVSDFIEALNNCDYLLNRKNVQSDFFSFFKNRLKRR